MVLVLSHTQASKEAQDLDGTQGPEERNGHPLQYALSIPDGSDGKESACNPGDLGLIPGLGRSLDGYGNPLQPGVSQEQRSLLDYTPWGCKELDATKHARMLLLQSPWWALGAQAQ